MLVFVVTSIANCLINTMSVIGDYSIHSKELFENTFMFKFDESHVLLQGERAPLNVVLKCINKKKRINVFSSFQSNNSTEILCIYNLK